jgi:multiple sugar transport system ATP-binding protein
MMTASSAAPVDAPVLELRDLSKSYGKVAVVHDVNLSITNKEFVVFVGPSGSGKSTLLRMIAGLEEVSGGDLLIDSKRVNDVPASDRGLAMVFQSYALYPHMTVRQNMAFSLENERRPRAEITERVEKAARILQIEKLLDRKPRQMSGGQRQRVAIGRAIVRNPRIFLFDEPLSNLDADLRVQTRNELALLHREISATMIYVTHDQVEAMTLADRIVVLNLGRIEQVGTPLELYGKPASRFVARFIGSPRMNVLAARVAAAGDGKVTLNVGGGQLTIATAIAGLTQDRQVEVGMRPEHLSLVADGADGLTLNVTTVEALGVETYLHGTLKDGQMVTVRLQGNAPVQPGAAVRIAPSAEDTHFFEPDETGRVIV